VEKIIKSEKPRRDFLNTLLGVGLTGWVIAILYPVLKYIIPPISREPDVKSIMVGKVADFKPLSGTIFKFGNKPGLLVRQANGDFKAFSATCSHLDCTVQYKEDMKVIWCACHNGKYDLNGNNISGPPPKPLEEFLVLIKGNEVYVKKES
jgi:Rieske Fe-S protein